VTGGRPADQEVTVGLDSVAVVRDGHALLDGISWQIRSGERWVLLGPNGSGKTTLLRVVGAALWPTGGRVEILGEQLGRIDLRSLRTRIATVSAAVARTLRPELPARDVVLTGRYAALETWWHEYTPADRRRAEALLADAGFGGEAFATRAFGLLSEGEPELLLLDEPAAGLDLAARERLLARVARLAADPAVPPLVFVTHHLEEIPPGVTHAALLRAGRLVAEGPVEQVLTSERVSAAYGLPVAVERRSGRWTARAEPGGR
jgi:iron complex transport system ATP-binding protein